MPLKFFAILLCYCYGFGSDILFNNINKNYPLTTARWIIQKGGSLRVDGSTNINKFSCKVPDYSTPDTITVIDNKELLLPMSGKISLEIVAFNCGNGMMTNDLRKTLKYKTFPKMLINFTSLSKIPELNKINADITGWVDIELAGIKKHFLVNYQFSTLSSGTFHLTGTKSVNFSDFNLTPPSKLGGMIKTNERLNVEFELNLAVIN